MYQPRKEYYPKIPRSSGPFADKIPLIKSLILNSVNKKHILKIYLFGSYSCGKAKKYSDIDLCVVMNNKVSRIKTFTKISGILHDNNIAPCDLLVYNQKYFYHDKNPESIENTIIEKGILLYG